MIQKWIDKINKNYILISFVLVLLVGAFMILGYANYFSNIANGYPYMETKLGYLPHDLIEMAKGYGQEGRSLYITTALSLDLLIPLIGSNFLTALLVYLMKQNNEKDKLYKFSIILGIFLCLFDWLENILMISVILTFRQFFLFLAILARIMTTGKYMTMIFFIAIIIKEIYKYRHRRNISN